MQIQSKHLLYFIVVLLCLSIIPSLALTPLSSLNEGRRALVIDEMFVHHHWLLPTMNGDLYLSKPPLLYWLSLLMSKLLGQVSEFSIRIPSAIAALLTLGLTYRVGRDYFNAYVGLLATVILATNLEFAMLARRAEIEMLLTLLCFSSWLSFIQYVRTQQVRWQWLSYILLAGAVMTKGPVALLFVILPAVVVAIVQRDKTTIAYLTNIRVWLMFILLAGLWYWLVSMQLGFDIWSSVVQKDMVDKMQSEASAKPMLSYVGWALVDFYGLLLLFAWRTKTFWQALKQHQQAWMLMLGAMIPFVLFSLFANKHTKYLLPIYPILALMIAWQISLLSSRFKQIFAKVALLAAVILLAGLSMFYLMLEVRYFDYRFSALRQFGAWYQPYQHQPIYALNQIDSRLIFYAKRPIPVVKAKQLSDLTQQYSNFILLSELNPQNLDSAMPHCTMQIFQPYLKRNKALYAYGFGSLCEKKDE